MTFEEHWAIARMANPNIDSNPFIRPIAECAWNAGAKAERDASLPAAVPEDARDEWISVEEQLPDLDTPVWLYEPGRSMWVGERGDSGDGWLWGNTYGSHYSRPDGTWSCTNNDLDDDYQPTHWMPLPAAPAMAQAGKEGK